MESDFKVLAGLLGRCNGKRKGGKYLREPLEIPLVVFARVVAGEVSGCNIRDRFGVDAYDLH